MKFFLKLKSCLFDRGILSRKLALLCSIAAFSTVSFAQQVVKGAVSSADTPVSSVTVSAKGSDIATLTDMKEEQSQWQPLEKGGILTIDQKQGNLVKIEK